MGDTEPSRLDRLLEVLCHAAEGAPRGAIDVRTLIPSLHMARRHVYSAVVELADAGYVEYAGAGPRVRLTPAGRSRVEHLQSRTSGG